MSEESTTKESLQAEEPVGVDNGLEQRSPAESTSGESDIGSGPPGKIPVARPAGNERTDSLAALTDWTDILSKGVPLLAGTIYIVGYFVTARRVAAHGASVTHLVDAQYFMAGLPLGALLLLTVAVAVLAWRHNPETDDGKLWKRVPWVVLGLFLFWVAVEVLDVILGKFWNKRILGQNWFDLYAMTIIRTALGQATLWFLIVSWRTGYFARLRKYLLKSSRDAGEVYQFQAFLLSLVVLVIITSSYRAMRVYDAIPQAFGGGKPVTVRLYLEREKAPKELLDDGAESAAKAREKATMEQSPTTSSTDNTLGYTVPLELLFRTSDTLLVALDIKGERRVWTLDGGIVHAIFFGGETPQPSTETPPPGAVESNAD